LLWSLLLSLLLDLLGGIFFGLLLNFVLSNLFELLLRLLFDDSILDLFFIDFLGDLLGLDLCITVSLLLNFLHIWFLLLVKLDLSLVLWPLLTITLWTLLPHLPGCRSGVGELKVFGLLAVLGLFRVGCKLNGARLGCSLGLRERSLNHLGGGFLVDALRLWLWWRQARSL